MDVVIIADGFNPAWPFSGGRRHERSILCPTDRTDNGDCLVQFYSDHR